MLGGERLKATPKFVRVERPARDTIRVCRREAYPKLPVELRALFIGVFRVRFGKVNERNVPMPRDTWTTCAACRALLDIDITKPADSYRRPAYMMLDADVVAVAPCTLNRVVRRSGCTLPAPGLQGPPLDRPGSRAIRR